MTSIRTALGACAFLFSIATTLPALSAPQQEPKALAREHFDRGVNAFNERRFAEAAKEFAAAYEASPSFVVLYNIGQVNAALGQAVESVDAFQTYLDQGGSLIPEERREAVLSELEKQRALIGVIVVRAEPDGASVHVDGKLVGRTPLEGSVRVTAGKHSVVLMLDGYQAQAREIEVAAGAQSELYLELQAVAQKSSAPDPQVKPVVVVTAPGAQTTSAAPTIVNVQVPRQGGPVLSTHQRTAGYVLGGLGIAVAAVGAYVAVSAIGDAQAAKRSGDNEAWSSSKTRNYWGWGIIGAGAVAATTGLVLTITGTSESTTGALRFTTYSNGMSHGILASALW